MDKTRASLRRVRVYAVLILGCLLYAGLPLTHREMARERAQHIIESANDWRGCRCAP